MQPNFHINNACAHISSLQYNYEFHVHRAIKKAAHQANELFHAAYALRFFPAPRAKALSIDRKFRKISSVARTHTHAHRQSSLSIEHARPSCCTYSRKLPDVQTEGEENRITSGCCWDATLATRDNKKRRGEREKIVWGISGTRRVSLSLSLSVQPYVDLTYTVHIRCNEYFESIECRWRYGVVCTSCSEEISFYWLWWIVDMLILCRWWENYSNWSFEGQLLVHAPVCKWIEWKKRK